ncbi:hypothetical protein ACO0RG_001396 [Hanseniaspora osmophila]
MSKPFFNSALDDENSAPAKLDTINDTENGDIASQETSIFDLKPFDEGEVSQKTRKAEKSLERTFAKKRQLDFYNRHTWHKFIGSFIVEGTATRPTTKPLIYGSKLSFLVTTLESNSKVKIKRSMGSLIKFWDPATRREVGRLPEKHASIIYPFLYNSDTEDPTSKKEVSFKATIVYAEPKRISVGDSFLVQIDCFLNSSLFELSSTTRPSIEASQLQNTTDLGHSLNGKKSSNILFGRNTDLDQHEEKLHRRRKALMTLFDELNLKPVPPNDDISIVSDTQNESDADQTLDVSTASAQKKEQENIEVIDLDDEDENDATKEEHQGSRYKKYYDERPNAESSPELSVNQLQNIYKITQSMSSLMDLPETSPSGGFQFTLRKYQAQGLSWMLKREHAFDKIHDTEFINANSNKMNPLWKKFKFPNDSAWSLNKTPDTTKETAESEFFNEPSHFYANLYSGEFSLKVPTVKLMTKGGILADEMGLGKTISTLSLISTVSKDPDFQPYDIVKISEDNMKPYAYQTTLVVVPMSLLFQWKSEFENAMAGSSKYCEIFYGDQSQKKNLIQHLCSNKSTPTVLLTTYGVVQSEFSKYAKVKQGNFGLFSVKFFRLVIDEGHSIRNKQTKTAKSVFELKSSRKWVLTGTPIINKLDDLYALVRFLDLSPFSEPGFWRTSVSEPFENKKYKAALDVVSTILEPVLLRRTKNMQDADGAPLVELPKKNVKIQYIELSPLERRLYQSFLQVAEKNVRDSLKKGELLKNYSSILVHILRLRQLCCDLHLLMKAKKNKEAVQQSKFDDIIMEEDSEENQAENVAEAEHLDLAQLLKMSILRDRFFDQKDLAYLQNKDEFFGNLIGAEASSLRKMECQICLSSPIEPLESIVFTECHHIFCSDCMDRYLSHKETKNESAVCPICRTPELAPARLLSPIMDNTNKTIASFRIESPPVLEDFVQSTKMFHLTNDLYELYDDNPSERVIIFSQFSTFLDVIQNELEKKEHDSRFSVSKFDGRLNLKERQLVLQKFDQDSENNQLKVLLISLKAGGVGLNLTKANKAFLMDIWWNAGIEDQAIDRIHRIGQERDVFVKRYIIKNSVEEKMLKIQERKRMLGEIVEGDAEERRQRRIEEIKSLFE